jgi:hypothetical protein
LLQLFLSNRFFRFLIGIYWLCLRFTDLFLVKSQLKVHKVEAISNKVRCLRVSYGFDDGGRVFGGWLSCKLMVAKELRMWFFEEVKRAEWLNFIIDELCEAIKVIFQSLTLAMLEDFRLQELLGLNKTKLVKLIFLSVYSIGLHLECDLHARIL